MTPSRRWPQIVLLVLVASWLGAARTAALPPGNEGCVFFSDTRSGYRGDIPVCILGGNGCYECAISATDGPDYFFCTEEWAGPYPPIANCAVQATFPDWWPDPNSGDQGAPGATLPPDATPPEDWPGDNGAAVDYGYEVEDSTRDVLQFTNGITGSHQLDLALDLQCFG